ncbi:MAG: CpaE family protein [Anaerolineales bacterium]
MKSNITQARIVAIGDQGPTQEQIVAALTAQEEFVLADLINSSERLMREIHASEPDVILVDHILDGNPTLDIIDDLALQNPEAAIVAILPGEDPLKAQQVMLAGARAFIVQPFTQINLLSTLRRVRELESRRAATKPSAGVTPEEHTRPVRTVTVFSPRGGVGTSTVAVNLALSLLEQTGKRVLLFEGKLFFGHLSVMLNLRTQNSLADLIPHAHSIDEGLVRDVVSHHASGLDVLLSPSNIQVSQGIRADDLYSVFVGVQRFYDYVIVDGGNTLSENSVTLMDACDRIMLVANPEMASLRDVAQFVQIGRSLAYSNEKMLIVINRVGMSAGLRENDVENALHHLVFAHIPDDTENALRSLNRGVPVFLKYGRSPITKSAKQLAKSFTGLSTTDPDKISIDSSVRLNQEALMASSRLG